MDKSQIISVRLPAWHPWQQVYLYILGQSCIPLVAEYLAVDGDGHTALDVGLHARVSIDQYTE